MQKYWTMLASSTALMDKSILQVFTRGYDF